MNGKSADKLDSKLYMKLQEFIMATRKPIGKPRILSQAHVYECELGPYWVEIKSILREASSDINIDVFKEYWRQRVKSDDLEYSNIFWADESVCVLRNVFCDETGEYFIRLKHGWAPVLNSLRLGQLIRLRHSGQPTLAEAYGQVYVYPRAKEYGIRI